MRRILCASCGDRNAEPGESLCAACIRLIDKKSKSGLWKTLSPPKYIGAVEPNGTKNHVK